MGIIYDAGNHQVGNVDSNGIIYDVGNRRVGSIDTSGTIYNAGNGRVGSIDSSGTIYNAGNSRVGNIDSSGIIYNVENRRIGSSENTIGGAAILLLNLEREKESTEPTSESEEEFEDDNDEEDEDNEDEDDNDENLSPLEQFKAAEEKFLGTQAVFKYKGSGSAESEQLVEQAIKYMVAKDDANKVSLFQQAAKQGHAGAQYALGEFYAEGSGVNESERKACYWYTKAAKQGHSQAQTNLAVLYYNGYTVFQNKTKAKYWFSKAEKKGDEIARKNLYNLDFDDRPRLILSIIVGLILGGIGSQLFYDHPFLGFLGGVITSFILVGEMRKGILRIQFLVIFLILGLLVGGAYLYCEGFFRFLIQ